MTTATRKFTCYACKRECETEWSEQEAVAEAEQRYGDPMPDPATGKAVSLCDACDWGTRMMLNAYGIVPSWEEPSVAEMPYLEVWCFRCERSPILIDEYREMVREEDWDVTPLACIGAVVTYEGTYNKANGHFCCTECYLAIGSPVGEEGQRWVAP